MFFLFLGIGKNSGFKIGLNIPSQLHVINEQIWYQENITWYLIVLRQDRYQENTTLLVKKIVTRKISHVIINLLGTLKFYYVKFPRYILYHL